MTTGYDVIWNGAHDGQDKDLLCIPPLPGVKEIGGMPDATPYDILGRPRHNQRFFDALLNAVLNVLRDGEWHSVPAISLVTMTPNPQIHVTIQRLTRAKLLDRRVLKHRTHAAGHRLYRLKAAA